MTKPAVEFEISANELRLVYRPRDDTSWVRERFERGDGLVVIDPAAMNLNQAA